MRRYPAFDPPEYVDWKPDPEVMDAFKARVPARLPSEEVLLRLYEGMVRNRLYDIGLKRWVRQGVISKAWLGTGEEAVTIGNVNALGDGDVVGPMIRNAGAPLVRGVPPEDLFKIFLGTTDTIARGRDIHFGDLARGVVSPTSFVASLVPVFAGLALSFKIRGERRVGMTWVGDGARWTGEFHEGMNLAASQRLPLIVVLQDNQVALGTRNTMHSRAGCETMASAYGVAGLTCDGNHVLDVYTVTTEAVAICRRGDGPVLLTANTFRMGGHATHDEAEARLLFPPEVFAHWGARDPIGMYETWLVDGHEVPRSRLEAIETSVTEEIETGAEAALARRQESKSAKVTEHDLVDGITSENGSTKEPVAARSADRS